MLDLHYDEVAADIARRDHIDSTRPMSPLSVADDAVVHRYHGDGTSTQWWTRCWRWRPEQRAEAGPVEPGGRRLQRKARDAPSSSVWYAVRPGGGGGGLPDLLAGRDQGSGARPRRSGPYVIAPVHRSNVDTLLVGCLTRRRHPLHGQGQPVEAPLVGGAVLSSLGGFPVHRGTPDREALRPCEEALRAGEPVVLFPEGTRAVRADVQPLFEGAAFVAARAGVPIVPVGIGGSEWAMPKGKRRHPTGQGGHGRGRAARARPARPPGGSGVPPACVAEPPRALHDRAQALFDEALSAGRAAPRPDLADRAGREPVAGVSGSGRPAPPRRTRLAVVRERCAAGGGIAARGEAGHRGGRGQVSDGVAQLPGQREVLVLVDRPDLLDPVAGRQAGPRPPAPAPPGPTRRR